MIYKKNWAYLSFTFLSSVAFERAIFVLFLSDLGYSVWQISALQIALFASNILAEVPTGVFADKFGRRFSLAMGTTLMAASVYGQFLAQNNFPLMFAFFIGHGISFAFISGTPSALLYDNLKAKNETDNYLAIAGAGRLVTGLGLGISMGIGGFLKVHSWHLVYMASAITLALAVLSLFFLAEHPHVSAEVESDKSSMKDLIREARRLLPIVLPFSLMHAAMTPYFVYSPKIFTALNMGTESISILIAFSEILGAGLTLIFVSGRFRWNLSKTASPILVIFAFCLALNQLGIVSVSILSFLASAALVLFLQSLQTDMIQSKIIDSRMRASILSFATFVDALAIGISYLLYGFLLENFQPGNAIAWTSLLPIVAAGVVVFQRKSSIWS